ncbi:MAG: hypothetical protein ACI4WF_00870 [Bacilli bacterium]
MIKLLVMIYNNEKKLKNILKKYKLNFNVMTYGSGTASLSLLTYFGLDKVKKSLYFSLIPSSLEKKVLQELETKLNLKQIGEGIGFTISLTSSNKFIKDILDKEGDMMENKDEYELIITIVKEGYSDLVMQAAKKEKATGGTVIYGRSLGSSRTILANLTIEPEKDIVLNIVPKEIKKQVMESINKETGVKTEARGLIMSIPIDNVIGLHEE